MYNHHVYFHYLYHCIKAQFILIVNNVLERCPSPKYKKYLIWPIKYIKHYKSIEYMKSTILSTNMIGNEKQKTWQKNTIFKSKMLKGLCQCYFNTCYFDILQKTSQEQLSLLQKITKNLHTIVLSTLTKLCKLDYQLYTTFL